MSTSLKCLISFFLTITSSLVIAQPVDYEPIPCDFNANGEVTNTRGHPDSSPFSVCDVPAEQITLKVFTMGLCTTQPTFSYANLPDLTSCQILYNNPTGLDVAVTESSGLNLPQLIRPNNGSYGYFFFVHSNTMSVKSTVTFDRPVTSSAAAPGSNDFLCWTTSSGVNCGDEVDQTYAPRLRPLSLPDSTYQELTERTSLGSTVIEYFADSNLRLMDDSIGTTTRWINLYLPTSNLIINDQTIGLKMSINVTSGAGLEFYRNGSTIIDTDRIDGIVDAPLAFVIEVLN